MSEALAVNLRRLRKVRKLTQTELAKRAGISRNAFRSIETGASKPRKSTFYSIAKALDVSVFDLVRDIPAVGNMRFRTSQKPTSWEKAEREQISVEVALWLLDYNSIEEITGERRPYDFKGIQFDRNDPVESAYTARAILMLDDEDYIRDFSSLIQWAGIKLLLIDSKLKGFGGLSVGSDAAGPAVIVNAGDRIPVEDQIFAAAHELGHLLMHPESYDSSIIEENDDQKKEADTFANYLLMPILQFDNKWRECRGMDWVDSVLHIKRLFSVSYKAVLDRLVAEGLADSDIHRAFVSAYNNRYDGRLVFREEPEAYPARSVEPSSMDKTDFIEDRLARLAMDALDKHQITMSRAAEILNITVTAVRKRVLEWDSLT